MQNTSNFNCIELELEPKKLFKNTFFKQRHGYESCLAHTTTHENIYMIRIFPHQM